LDPESRRTFRRDGGEIGMKKLLFVGVVAGIVAATAAQWAEIQRYMKIRAMS
jgi:uncharacterized protein DUF6893